MSITEILNKQSKSFLTALGVVLVMLIGMVDYLTGPSFSSLTFYLIPVILITWFVGRTAGILMSVASALTWVIVDMTAGPSYPHIIIPLWNLLERLGTFFIVVYILLRIAKAEEESRRLERERKDMLSMFAHDMKNPLITVGGFLSRLISGKAGLLTEKQANYVELMRDELRRLERYITDFLELSRLESTGYEPVPAPFNMAAALKMRIEMARIEADKKDINIQFDIPEDTAVMVGADAIQIDRVIANLMDNAIKYTGPGGTITVKLLDRDTDVLVQIADTGIGIPEEHVQHIFNAFYRVGRDTKGSGLGLSIAKRTVEANGGKIWVESVHEKGSVFSFTLPKQYA
jgi:signal transduction histidine kinase